MHPYSLWVWIGSRLRSRRQRKAGEVWPAGDRDSSPGQPDSPIAGLWQAHAVGVVRHRRRPVGEDAEDADLLGQHVKCDQDVTIVVEGVQRRLVVELRARSALRRQHFLDDAARALEGPGDDIEPSLLGLLGV